MVINWTEIEERDGVLYAVGRNSWGAEWEGEEPDPEAADREQMELEHARQYRDRQAAIAAELESEAAELRW